ncbi:MAG: NAD(P) transhydrogenase subunit alpha [Planctomycetota bacterium]|jgi:NAD(P) transhydrogenase subunit alpha|nr:NAD(P) transhydrogenase subunit alpha [Planctomycetota bacterium]MDP6519739.1 NAD(P) transhydrogenase subunit alpha [Planctomycetota bacterium]MDP6837321.1 NAD(P) transhydrogenase subunit alpha [Planctomycetota bacterium]MDP6956747.1 NAD(P) transhydrogenase subunit alpha [Planctomycetota bacterium]
MNISVFLAALQAEGAAPLPFVLVGLWILVLAAFTGFEIITKVPPTLHTPLMSGANAISGITLVGALYCVFEQYSMAAHVLGCLAIGMATINVVGGFMVTDRMLAMFSTKKKGGK